MESPDNSAITRSEPYRTLLSSLLPPITPHVFSSLPKSPHHPHVPSNRITSLSLNPTIESALHLLNLDLPSAHFLLRHMQAPPAYEAMFLHGILHRIEGDYDNARAWYGNVSDSEVFQYAWQGEEGKVEAMAFLDGVERWRKGKPKERSKEMEEELQGKSLNEIKRVLCFCESKFGTGVMNDASGVWIKMDDKHKAKANEMVVGGEGWREF